MGETHGKKGDYHNPERVEYSGNKIGDLVIVTPSALKSVDLILKGFLGKPLPKDIMYKCATPPQLNRSSTAGSIKKMLQILNVHPFLLFPKLSHIQCVWIFTIDDNRWWIKVKWFAILRYIMLHFA